MLPFAMAALQGHSNCFKGGSFYFDFFGSLSCFTFRRP